MSNNKTVKAKELELDTKKIVENSILNVEFGNESKANLVIFIIDKEGFSNAQKSIYGKVIKEEINYNDFKPTTGKIANVGIINGKKVIFVGFGKDKKSKKNEINNKDSNLTLQAQKLGASIADLVPGKKKTTVYISNKFSSLDDKMLIEVYFGFNQKIYRFSKYLTDKEKLEKLPQIDKIVLSPKSNNNIAKNAKIKDLISKRQNQLRGIFYTRTLGNEPANTIYPESFAKEMEKAFSGIKNINFKVLGEKELKKLGMNMLLGVAQGSTKEPKVVVVEYNGNKKSKKIDLALVGKGVTFDSGGLSLKPSPYMEGMKCDMLGATTVLSSLLSMAKNELKINAVAVAGMVENMPDGNAQKVGDIVKSMSGKTVEIIDTDAEGRLVLGDVLYYAQSVYKPEYLIDVATLTGAIMVALGTERAGIFSNNDKMAEKIKESGENTGDRCWVMPMGEEYADAMKSQIADLRNLSSVRYAGSATAGEFLHNFIGDNQKWAHIDIAGVDTATKNNSFSIADFASGFGVKLLNDFVEKNIEKVL